MIQPVEKTTFPLLLYILAHSVASDMSHISCITASTCNSSLACFFDSVEMLSCVWTPAADITEAPCNLTASGLYGKAPEPCQLYDSRDRSCHLILERYTVTIVDIISLVVTCHSGAETKAVQKLEMYPFKNLQLRPPCNLQMENTSKESCSLTWKLCGVAHYLKGKVEYEVQYKIHSSGEAYKTLCIIQDQKWLKFENLSPGRVYEAAVRAKVRNNDGFYQSIWSNWSTPIIWETEPEAPPPHVVLVVVVSLVSILLLAIALLARSPMLKRLKKVLKIRLPNPDEFFPSLKAVHGDVQKWLSSSSSMPFFHIATAASDISVLEIMPKGCQDPTLHLPKGCHANMGTPELSEYSSSSCFINGGYFFFQHHDSFDFELCKVYFTYDLIPHDSSGREGDDSCSYILLQETSDSSQPSSPTYSVTATQEHGCLGQGGKDPTEEAEHCSRILLCRESFSASPKEEPNGNQGKLQPIILPSWPPQECSICDTGQSGSNGQGTGDIQNADPPAANHRPAFPQSKIQNCGHADVFCRAASSSQLPSPSEVYLSMRDLQSHYGHHSI
ncbi:hypothetical protein JRQ81_016303 [Phrynocephalus forsythii]|uniref:Interleukin-2 receptor subunit beta n=1 Tax=Phrynocephalus forsythii TaxID=171643 RepID=A0A9Q0XWK7_9SAUR|nr:hypothetical protein JRQ81_016303 [Phrynocephalus forsythii]